MASSNKTIDAVLDSRGYSYSTREAYARWIAKLQQYFPDRKLDDLGSAEIQDFISHLRSMRYKDTSRRQAVQALKFLFREVLKPEQEPKFPSIRQPIRAQKLPTQAEVLRTLDEISSPALKLMCQLIYGLGLELQEAKRLRVSNIHLATSEVHIRTQRTSAARRVRIPFVAIKPLADIVAIRKSTDLLFTAREPNPYTDAGIQRGWASARRRAGVGSHATLRSLRHCYIWHLEQLGVKLFDVIANVGIRPERAVPYYSAYHTPNPIIEFSPLDRRVDESSNRYSRQIPYISEARIAQVASIGNQGFDYSKLVVLLRELNAASSAGSLYSIAMLVRAIIDHVPPAFGQDRFLKVANNYAGTRSFKESMLSLEGALRLVANSYLHTHIRNSEVQPNSQQVDFRAQIDQLLAELVRIGT